MSESRYIATCRLRQAGGVMDFIKKILCESDSRGLAPNLRLTGVGPASAQRNSRLTFTRRSHKARILQFILFFTHQSEMAPIKVGKFN